MKPRCVMLLDDETVAFSLELAATRLLGLREVALAVVGFDIKLGLPRHDSSPLARPGSGFLRRSAPCCRLGAAALNGWLCLGFFVPKALLQRGHQVDDI